jgi:hypothetical protein
MGTIHARPFNDPRNTRVVDNNDPNARNKLYVGIPGTHLEQRCCNDKAPFRLPEGTGWYVDEKGTRICEIIEYWARPENRERAKDGWWNAPTPPGYYVEMAATGELTCGGCFGNEWDRFLEDLSRTLDEILPVVQGIAMAVSYIPVFGTAASFVLNSAVNVARGRSLDEAALDAIGNALPGQPASGAAFRTVRTILRDGSLDEVALSLLPVDENSKKAISSSVGIAVAIANGQPVTMVVLDEIYQELPPTGKRGFDVGRRLINGEEIEEIVVDEATREAAALAKAQGEQAVNGFLIESGFQGVIETMDPHLQAALRAGIGIGHAATYLTTARFDDAERNVAVNDQWAANGRAIIDAGAAWKGRRFSAIRSADSYVFTRKAVDPLTHREQLRTDVYVIDDHWQRGFDIAVGLCEGRTSVDDEQRSIRLSIMKLNAVHGFDVGQYLQRKRALSEWRDYISVDLSVTDALEARRKGYYFKEDAKVGSIAADGPGVSDVLAGEKKPADYVVDGQETVGKEMGRRQGANRHPSGTQGDARGGGKAARKVKSPFRNR